MLRSDAILCPVELTTVAMRSEQQIAVGWRPARMRLIDRLSGTSKVLENPLSDGRYLDACNEPERPAAPERPARDAAPTPARTCHDISSDEFV